MSSTVTGTHRKLAACLLLASLLGAALTPAAAGAQEDPAATGELHLTLLHTSDEHSALLPTPFAEYRPGDPGATRGGFARLATVVAEERARRAAAGEPVLLTSAGDNVGDSPFAWLILDGEAAELGLMVEIGYDVVILGNHEFDYGSERLAAYLGAAGFPEAGERTALVATNTRPPPGHPLGERGIRRTHLVTLPNGLRVGFIGLLGEAAARFTPFAPPVQFADAREVAATAAAELRAAGAQVIVAVTHSGLEEDRALARAVPEIDVILGGHDHRLLEAPLTEGGTLIVHPGAHLRQLARLELAYDPETGAVRARNADTGSPHVVPLDASVPEDPAVAARIDGYRRQLDARVAELSGGRVGGVGEPVVHSEFPITGGRGMGESELGNFVADAVRAAAAEATGLPVDVAFQSSGLIRTDLVPGARDWNRGRIPFYDLASAVGVGFGPDGRPGYPLVSVWLTGDEVRRALEVSILLSELMGSSYYLQASGVRTRYDRRRAVLGRIPIRGTPIPTGRALLSVTWTDAGPLERGDEALYHVVTDSYVLSFLPMVGEVVPRLTMVPKDRHGRPIDDLDEAIVRRDGEELKVRQAVLEFAAAQPRGTDGRRWVADRYAAPSGRLVQARAAPLWLWPAGAVVLVLVPGALLLLRRRRRSSGRK